MTPTQMPWSDCQALYSASQPGPATCIERLLKSPELRNEAQGIIEAVSRCLIPRYPLSTLMGISDNLRHEDNIEEMAPTKPSWRRYISASELTDHLPAMGRGSAACAARAAQAHEHRPFSPTIRAYIFVLPRCLQFS